MAGALVFTVCAAVASPGANAQAAQPVPADALKLPPNYRNFIARAVIFQYDRTAKGRPGFSERMNGPKAMDFCVRFPIAKRPLLFEQTTGTEIRSFRMTISRSIFGQLAFTYEGAGQIVDTPCQGPLKPFAELEALGHQVKACRAKTGGACGADAFALPSVIRDIKKLP
jgi:hypothetical protein